MPEDTDSSVVGPTQTINRLAHIIRNLKESVDIIIAQPKGQIVLRTPDIEVVSTLSNGTFPKCEQLVPNERATRKSRYLIGSRRLNKWSCISLPIGQVQAA